MSLLSANEETKLGASGVVQRPSTRIVMYIESANRAAEATTTKAAKATRERRFRAGGGQPPVLTWASFGGTAPDGCGVEDRKSSLRSFVARASGPCHETSHALKQLRLLRIVGGGLEGAVGDAGDERLAALDLAGGADDLAGLLQRRQ